MRKLLMITLVLAGCAAGDDTADELTSLPNIDDSAPVAAAVTYATGPSVCSLLPDDGSACAHACDQDALDAFVPEGTCVVLDCPLTDGTIYRTGGCNL